MMQQAQISTFLKRFFQATNCPIIEEKNGYFTVQLTVEMDKELMNRPFYWHYLEKTGGTPNPMKLTFITDSKEAPEDVKVNGFISDRRDCTKFLRQRRKCLLIFGYMNRQQLPKQTCRCTLGLG